VEQLLEAMFIQARAQFGEAIKGYWFHESELCPGCSVHPIGEIKYKGKDAISLNAFIYRARGILIGYFLCETCALYIFESAQRNPYQQTPLHAEIERNLIAAYTNHLKNLNA
jgi:hypothetical protein